MANIDGSFTGTSGYQQALNNYNANPGASQGAQQLSNYGQQFANQFYNLVGRNPTADEASQFYQQIVAPHKGVFFQDQLQNLHDLTQQFVSDTFQRQAQDVSTQKLQDQTGQAQTLANQFRAQGNQSIDNVQQSLMDYQSKLFDKLRPQLLTSLQSQGLLNTGGLNDAMAGAQYDLATAGQGALLDARMNNENAANQIAFSGASAPYQYQQSQALNSVPYLQSQGQTASNNAYGTFMNNLAYNQQMNLLNRQGQIQSDMQPSMLSTLGHSFATSFGNAAGNVAPNLLNTGMQSFTGGGLGSGGSSVGKPTGMSQ